MNHIRGLVTLGVAVAALVAIALPARAGLITNGCVDAASCTVPELLGGAKVTVGDVTLSNWGLVGTSSFEPPALMVESNARYAQPEVDQIHLTPTAPGALRADSGRKSIAYEFRASADSGSITGVRGTLRFREVNGFVFDSPRIELATVVGSEPGLGDFGTSRDAFALRYDPSEPWVDVPGVDDVWVRVILSLAANSGFARSGFVPSIGVGPALETTFRVEETTHVPAPATLPLLIPGLAALGALGLRRRARRAG